MNQKTTSYALRRRREAKAGKQAVVAKQWLRTIVSCTPFTENKRAAEDLLLIIREALEVMLTHNVPPDDPASFNLLAHAIDVAHVRYMQIAGSGENPAHEPLMQAKAALAAVRERRVHTGRWELDDSERSPLVVGVDLYEEALNASTPAQMYAATQIVLGTIKRGKIFAPQKSEAQ